MIRSAVTVSLVPEALGGPFVFWHDLPDACRKAQALGFDGIEIFPPGPEAVDVPRVQKLLSDHGLALAAMGTGAGWVKHKLHLCVPDAAARQRAKAFIKSIIEVAGSLGAPAIIGSMQGRHGDGVDRIKAWGYLTESAHELGEHARGHGVPLLFEPINRYETNMVSSIDTGLDLIRDSGSDNVRLLADLFHMNIEEVNSAASLRKAGKAIGHVHFVDSNRRPAGLGHIDYQPIAAALREIGYDRFLSAEALPYPDPESAARQTIEAFGALKLL